MAPDSGKHDIGSIGRGHIGSIDRETGRGQSTLRGTLDQWPTSLVLRHMRLGICVCKVMGGKIDIDEAAAILCVLVIEISKRNVIC